MWSETEQGSRTPEGDAQAYVYPPVQAPEPGAKAAAPNGSASTLERLWHAEAYGSGGITEEQVQAREAAARQAGWQRGRQEGEAAARGELEKKLVVERATLSGALQDFAKEREAYFRRVEAEVVGLSLAIARKILHREAQVDPLLLAGVVRVSMDKVAVGTHTRLRVPPDQIPAWQGFFAQQPGLLAVPELMGDASLGPGHCLLETELGSTDLTLEAQLKEIEQGFFDLLAQRPQNP